MKEPIKIELSKDKLEELKKIANSKGISLEELLEYIVKEFSV